MAGQRPQLSSSWEPACFQNAAVLVSGSYPSDAPEEPLILRARPSRPSQPRPRREIVEYFNLYQDLDPFPPEMKNPLLQKIGDNIATTSQKRVFTALLKKDPLFYAHVAYYANSFLAMVFPTSGTLGPRLNNFGVYVKYALLRCDIALKEASGPNFSVLGQVFDQYELARSGELPTSRTVSPEIPTTKSAQLNLLQRASRSTALDASTSLFQRAVRDCPSFRTHVIEYLEMQAEAGFLDAHLRLKSLLWTPIDVPNPKLRTSTFSPNRTPNVRQPATVTVTAYARSPLSQWGQAAAALSIRGNPDGLTSYDFCLGLEGVVTPRPSALTISVASSGRARNSKTVRRASGSSESLHSTRLNAPVSRTALDPSVPALDRSNSFDHASRPRRRGLERTMPPIDSIRGGTEARHRERRDQTAARPGGGFGSPVYGSPTREESGRNDQAITNSGDIQPAHPAETPSAANITIQPDPYVLPNALATSIMRSSWPNLRRWIQEIESSHVDPRGVWRIVITYDEMNRNSPVSIAADGSAHSITGTQFIRRLRSELLANFAADRSAESQVGWIEFGVSTLLSGGQPRNGGGIDGLANGLDRMMNWGADDWAIAIIRDRTEVCRVMAPRVPGSEVVRALRAFFLEGLDGLQPLPKQ